MGVFGPSGGYGGQRQATQGATTATARLGMIHVWHGLYINAIELVYVNPDRSVSFSSTFGNSSTGGTMDTIILNQGEYLVQIYGRVGDYVDHLSVVTSFQRHFSYGGSGGAQYYEYSVSGGEAILGFFGNTGNWIDSIGVFTGSAFE